ncbi:hypothetical protein NPIL_226411 [Nephila pilipes]|uniref:Uncharacterized protein n=1 Tax=Nephila pilipes TaxID=299642 RepID=A0A8X6R9Z4_NEPPI|nr:hypothetical protein NPIL_226411 [Nephila pilipes]
MSVPTNGVRDTGLTHQRKVRSRIKPFQEADIVQAQAPRVPTLMGTTSTDFYSISLRNARKMVVDGGHNVLPKPRFALLLADGEHLSTADCIRFWTALSLSCQAAENDLQSFIT